MGNTLKRRRTAVRVPGVELLRLAHAGASSGDPRKENAAESIYSLLALRLTDEMVDVPVGMKPYYEMLAR